MLTYSQVTNGTDRISRAALEVLAHGRTAYQEYLFFRSAAHGVCVALDGDVQSCEADEAVYHEALVHPALLLHPGPRRVLVMGGGEGATVREVLRHPCVEKVCMVDLDREFVDLCRNLLPDWNAGVFEDPRVELRCEDIHDYLQATDERFDAVIGDLVDVNDWDSPAAELYSATLYRRLKPRLAEGAVLSSQAGSLSPADIDGHNYVRRGLMGQFTHVESYGMTVPSFYHLWGYVLASDRPLLAAPGEPGPELEQRAAERRLSLPATGAAALRAGFTLPALIHRRLLARKPSE